MMETISWRHGVDHVLGRLSSQHDVGTLTAQLGGDGLNAGTAHCRYRHRSGRYDDNLDATAILAREPGSRAAPMISIIFADLRQFLMRENSSFRKSGLERLTNNS